MFWPSGAGNAARGISDVHLHSARRDRPTGESRYADLRQRDDRRCALQPALWHPHVQRVHLRLRHDFRQRLHPRPAEAAKCAFLGKTSEVHLLKPIDILPLRSDGIKSIADTGLSAVVVYDAADKYAGKIATPKLRPVSLAVHGNELYVADIYASRVRVFDRFNGKELRTIGQPMTENNGKGQLGGVMGIAIDNEGNLYANDVLGCRVQKFSPDGKFIYSIGSIGNHVGNFVRPKHMAVDSSGILYVVDNAFQNVQMFNDKGQMLMFFGAPGTHPGAMLEMPAGICTTDADVTTCSRKYGHPDFEVHGG